MDGHTTLRREVGRVRPVASVPAPWARNAALPLVAVERFDVGKGSPVQLLVPGTRLRLSGAPLLGAGFAALLLAITVGLLSASSAEADAAGQAPSQSVQEELAKFGALAAADIDDVESPAELAPDISLLADRAGSAADDADAWWVPVRDRLLERPEVAFVAIDFPADDATAFHVGLDQEPPGRASVTETAAELVDLVEAEASDGLIGVSVDAGGRALSDESIVSRFAGSVRWLALLALVLAGYVVWRFGLRRGLVAAFAWSASALLAGRIAGQVVGPFDGTVATGPFVGALAGLLFALVVGLRVLKWHENPVPIGGAEAIQRSLAEVASDVILVLGSLVAVVGVLWISGGSSRVIVAAIVGGLVGAAFTGAVTAPALAALGSDDGEPGRLLPYPVPTGGQLLVITVLGLVGLLVVLSAFAFRSPGRDLIDYRALPAGDETRTIGDLLGSGPGDPTEAIVSVVDTTSPEATQTWAQAVATLSNVAWVDTVGQRFTGAGPRTVDPAQSLASEEQIGFEAVELAVIVPAVPVRSAEGALLVDEVVRLADERVTIDSVSGPVGRGSTALVVATILLLALAGAGTVLVETDNAGFALTSFVLRLLGGGATVGLYRLVSADATAFEAVAALTLVAVTVSLFELEYLHDRVRFGRRWSASAGLITVPADGSAEPSGLNGSHPANSDVSALSNGSGLDQGSEEGETAPAAPAEAAIGGSTADPVDVPARAGLLAAVGLMLAALWMALTRFAGGGPTVGRFGFALAVALAVEIALGFLVLRPALLGEQAAYHSVARPLRSTLYAGQRRQRSEPVSVDDPAWRRLVSDLLMAEFGLQTDPANTRPDAVFLEGTPLFGQASEQHRSLLSSALRVSGRAPRIRQVETFREGPSIMVSVTVDHPERHLVDENGTVYGVRRPQRRSTMLWLVGLDSGAVRIAESMDMGSVPLDVDKTPDKTTFPEVATVSG